MSNPNEDANPVAVLRGAALRECDARALFRLPTPEETEITSTPLEELPEILRLCECAMLAILKDIKDGKLSIDAVESTADGSVEVPLWSGALCVCGMYHEACVSRICSEALLGKQVTLSEKTRITELLEITSADEEDVVATAAYLLARYLQIYLALCAFRERAVNSLGATVYLSLLRFALSPIGDLAAFTRNEAVYPLNAFAILAAKNALSNLSSALEKVSESAERDMDQLVSRLSAADLKSLAVRSPDAARYLGGSKHIETEFERGLAFLLQSFGFYVSSARKGEKAIDLVCVSGDREPYTILVEAKTSRKDYFLPTKDARALREYAATARVSLSTLPGVELLLVVGPAAARTLSAKLKSLEADIGIPTRYCDISLLSDLRRHIPGPIPAQPFLRALKLSKHVVSDSAIDAIAGEYERLQDSHDQFVRQMLTKGAALDRLLLGK